MFIVFSGMPGTGKSTIAARLAAPLQAVYLRIDSIEQAIFDHRACCLMARMSDRRVISRLIGSPTRMCVWITVIADSVNPLKITCDAYRDVASGQA